MVTVSGVTINDPNPAEIPVAKKTGWLHGWRRKGLLVLAVAVVLFAAGDIYHYATKSTTSSVGTVVAAWAPNHKDFCAAAVALTHSSDKSTAKSETRLLLAFEELSVHAPTKSMHRQLAAVTVAFDNVINDPAALKAIESGATTSKIPEVKAFLAAVIPVESGASPTSVAISSCTGGNPASANTVSALAAANAAYYAVVAGDSTGAPTPVTVAEYSSDFVTEHGESVTADGPDARFNFPTGPPVCVTMPNANEEEPTTVACPPTS